MFSVMAQSLRDDVGCQACLHRAMQCLVSLDNPVELDALKSHLEEQGVACWVMDGGMGELHPQTGLFPYRVMVHEEDWGAAETIAKGLGLR